MGKKASLFIRAIPFMVVAIIIASFIFLKAQQFRRENTFEKLSLEPGIVVTKIEPAYWELGKYIICSWFLNSNFRICMGFNHASRAEGRPKANPKSRKIELKVILTKFGTALPDFIAN